MKEIKAKLKYLRMPPRKVRLVADLIKGMRVVVAERQLNLFSKRAASPILKLLKSAVANAEHNLHLDKKNLYVESIIVDGGPVLKRFRARAFDRAAPIRKRTSHVNLVLGVREGGEKLKVKAPAVFGKKEEEAGKESDERQAISKAIPEIKRPRRAMAERPRIMKRPVDFVRRVFRRKVI